MTQIDVDEQDITKELFLEYFHNEDHQFKQQHWKYGYWLEKEENQIFDFIDNKTLSNILCVCLVESSFNKDGVFKENIDKCLIAPTFISSNGRTFAPVDLLNDDEFKIINLINITNNKNTKSLLYETLYGRFEKIEYIKEAIDCRIFIAKNYKFKINNSTQYNFLINFSRLIYFMNYFDEYIINNLDIFSNLFDKFIDCRYHSFINFLELVRTYVVEKNLYNQKNSNKLLTSNLINKIIEFVPKSCGYDLYKEWKNWADLFKICGKEYYISEINRCINEIETKYINLVEIS